MRAAAACNLRIQALRTEAADLRSKAQVLVEMIGHLGNVAERTQALLRSAGDLLLAWDALRPEERRERLHQLVALIVVEKAGSGGDSNTARIHFRAVIGSQEAHRRALKGEIAKMAENAPGAENNRPQSDSDLEADVMCRCWLPDRDECENFLEVIVFSLPSPLAATQRPFPRRPKTNLKTVIQQAFEFQRLLDERVVNNRAELAERYSITRARVTQVMQLLKLPTTLLDLLGESGNSLCSERQLRHLLALPSQEDRIAAFEALRVRGS